MLLIFFLNLKELFARFHSWVIAYTETQTGKFVFIKMSVLQISDNFNHIWYKQKIIFKWSQYLSGDKMLGIALTQKFKQFYSRLEMSQMWRQIISKHDYFPISLCVWVPW